METLSDSIMLWAGYGLATLTSINRQQQQQ